MFAHFKHILAVIDGQQSWEIVAALAIDLAQKAEGDVVFLLDTSGYKGEPPVADLTAALKDKITLRDGEAQVRDIRVSDGQPVNREVAHMIEGADYTLIVKQAEPHKLFRELFRNNQDKYFISECPLPVWMVKPGGPRMDTDILTCVDLNNDHADKDELNREILEVSDTLAKMYQKSLHVIDCYFGEIGTLDFHFDAKDGFRREASLKEQHESRMKQYIDDYCINDGGVHYVEGIPDEIIPETAIALNSELAVIGEHKKATIKARLFGDTAVQLAEKMPCDILILKA